MTLLQSVYRGSFGRVLGTMDHYTTADGARTLVAQVPTRGVRTIYSRVGDLFSWLCLAGLVVLGRIVLSRRKALVG